MNNNYLKNKQIHKSLKLSEQVSKQLRKIVSTKRSKHSQQEKTVTRDVADDFRDRLQNQIAQLLQDNKRLTMINQALQQQNYCLKKQLEENKKYSQFMTNFNQDLKNQLLQMINRPNKSFTFNQSSSRYSKVEQLKQELNNLKLSNDIMTLRLQNRTKQIQFSQHQKSQNYKKSRKISQGVRTVQSIRKDNNYAMPKKSQLGMCKKKNCNRKNNKLCACHSNYLKTGDFLY